MPPLTRLTVALSLCLAVLAAPTAPVHADDTIIHTVQPGENLFRIGLKYGIQWTAITQANGLGNTEIFAGQQLIIPSTGGSLASPAPAAPPSEPTLAQSLTYTVVPGDTLLNIAARYGTSAYAIAAANGLANMNLIFSGQRLAIPGGATAPSATAPAAGGGKRILVDISEQRLYAYQDGQLVYDFIASTGLPGQDTQPGSYSVLNKIPLAYGGNWNIWMPNWMGIYWAGSLENGIHALPILPNGSRLWAGVLGRPVSYGCVVLGQNDSQLLFDWATIGTPVTIQW